MFNRGQPLSLQEIQQRLSKIATESSSATDALAQQLEVTNALAQQVFTKSEQNSNIAAYKPYLDLIQNGIERYQKKNAVKLEKLSPNNPGVARVTKLIQRYSSVLIAIENKNAPEIKQEFDNLKSFVDSIVSGKDYEKLHRPREDGLDTILKNRLEASVNDGNLNESYRPKNR